MPDPRVISPDTGPTGDHTNCYRPRREGAALHLPCRGPYILGTSESERGHMPLRFRPMRSSFLALPLLAALIAAGADVSAQDRRVPASPNEVRLSYAPVVQRAAPAVVNVYAARAVANRNPFMDD